MHGAAATTPRALDREDQTLTDDFDLPAYRRLLELALEQRFELLAFHDDRRFSAERALLLRHDVDTDLHAALQLARIEAELGVRSTFFLMLRSPLYNLFARANHDMVREIVALGHDLGVHYDEGFSPGEQRTLEEWVLLEADTISRVFGVPVRAVSFHQPSRRVLDEDIAIPGMVNTYNARDLEGIFYLSDSNKAWRGKSPSELFASGEHPRIHLLIHPMWWAGTREEPAARGWDRVILANWERSQAQLLATERAFGPRRRLILEPEGS
ncbi:MAG: hypothetical protein KDD82_26990 [Planctomycetes bacterium]|nr:hypothetical protein [Planctomycetota bacterium]